jgi:hypothetical protein
VTDILLGWLVKEALSRQLSLRLRTRKEDFMSRRRVLTGSGLLAIGFLVVGSNFLAADEQKVDHKPAAPFEQCAKACTDCLRECESCVRHCAHLVASGKKDHLGTLGTCADCAELCTAGARIVSRHGPLTGTICEACAKACDTCATACEKHGDDEHVQRCAKVCRDCAKDCRDMLKHLGEDGGK